MKIETAVDLSPRTRITVIRTRARPVATAGKLPRHHTNRRTRRQPRTVPLPQTNITHRRTITQRASTEPRRFLRLQASKQHRHIPLLPATQVDFKIIITAHRPGNISQAPNMVLFHHLLQDILQLTDIAPFHKDIIVCDPCRNPISGDLYMKLT